MPDLRPDTLEIEKKIIIPNQILLCSKDLSIMGLREGEKVIIRIERIKK